MTELYATDDLDEAAYIESRGLRHITIERNPDGRCSFIFSDPDRARALAREFTNSTEAEFARARRGLAWKLHRV